MSDACQADMGEGFGRCGAPMPCGMHRAAHLYLPPEEARTVVAHQPPWSTTPHVGAAEDCGLCKARQDEPPLDVGICAPCRDGDHFAHHPTTGACTLVCTCKAAPAPAGSTDDEAEAATDVLVEIEASWQQSVWPIQYPGGPVKRAFGDGYAAGYRAAAQAGSADV